MELVPLSDRTLTQLAQADRELRRVFEGVFPADRLPKSPSKTVRAAYIVNTDPAGEPGQHWLALWTKDNVLEVFDSYGLPLNTYRDPELTKWIKQWKYVVTSDMTLQAMDSQTCGHYALMFLKAKARGATFQEFLSQWYHGDYVGNDHIVANRLKQDIERVLDEDESYNQKNVSRYRFCYCNEL